MPAWIKMPLSELTTPNDKRTVIANQYWAITDDGYALFFHSYAWPQCNTNKVVVERLWGVLNKQIGPTHPVFVEMAFVP